MSAAEPVAINRERRYTTAEVAEILELHVKTVYAIPDPPLRRVRVGPRRGRVRIKGSDLIDYIEGRTV